MAVSGITTNFYIVGRQLADGKFRMFDSFVFASGAVADSVERSVNDPERKYIVLNVDATTIAQATSGVLQNQIDRSWLTNFSYSSQTAKTFKSNSSTFEKTTPFCFPGTSRANPTAARIFGFTQQVSTIMTARVFDVTNGNEISRMTISGVDVVMAEDTNLTNLPSEMATFEVQIKSSDKKSVELESFEMR